MNKTLYVNNDLKLSRGVSSAGFCSFEGDENEEYSSKATNDFRIIYIKRGKIRFIKNGKTALSANAGKLILLTPGSRSETVCSPDCLDYWVAFTGFNDVLRELGISERGICSKKSDSDKESIRQAFEDIITELQLKEKGYSVAAEAKLLKLLLYFCRERSASNFSFDSKKKKIAPALLIMNNEFNKTYSMDYYAKKCNISKSSFLHSFTKIMGTTPIKYLNEIKIKNAAVMLTETDMSISEISFELGFSSVQYFSNTFFAFVKQRPSEYRKINRKE